MQSYLRHMDELLKQIDLYKQEMEQAASTSVEEVEAFRIRFLGTKGILKAVMGEMKNVPAEKRKDFGLTLNAFKIFAEEKYASLKEASEAGTQTIASEIDWSLPGDPIQVGTRHPLTIVRNQIVSIF